MAPQNVSLALHFNNNCNYLDNSPKTYFLEKAFIKARAPRRGIPVSKHYASKSKTSLLTGLSNLEPLPVSTVTDRTRSWTSGWVATTLPKCHLFRGDWFSFSNATSPTLKFPFGRVHLILAWNCCKYSLLHLDQTLVLGAACFSIFTCSLNCWRTVQYHQVLSFLSGLMNSSPSVPSWKRYPSFFYIIPEISRAGLLPRKDC